MGTPAGVPPKRDSDVVGGCSPPSASSRSPGCIGASEPPTRFQGALTRPGVSLALMRRQWPGSCTRAAHGMGRRGPRGKERAATPHVQTAVQRNKGRCEMQRRPRLRSSRRRPRDPRPTQTDRHRLDRRGRLRSGRGWRGGSGRWIEPIHELSQVDGRLMMHGGQEGRSWAAIIQGDTGRLSAGVVDHEGGLLIFDTCTTP